MSLLIVAPFPVDEWLEALRGADPTVRVRVWPDVPRPEEITAALVWKPDLAALCRLPNLKLVLSMGAGVDHILERGRLPDGVRLTRIVDEDLSAQMAQYVTYHVLRYHRGFDAFVAAQRARRWDPPPPRDTAAFTVGLMGYGVLGRRVAAALRSLGFPVIGYRRTRGPDEEIPLYCGDELPNFLARAQALVCLLPLSPETRGMIGTETLSRLPQGAYLIAVGRGEQLVAEDVLAALDSGELAAATLDVFAPEPLPTENPFWSHPHVFVTPHCAADILPSRGALAVLDNLSRFKEGRELIGEVDLARGY